MSIQILIVDAYDAHRNVLVGFLNHIRPDVDVHQLDPSRAGSPQPDFDWAGYALVIMDSRLCDEDGLQWFEDLRSTIDNFPQVLFLSSQNNVDIAVKAMKLGAKDFLLKKNIQQDRLKEAITSLLPDPPPPADVMPELKPLPDHHNTMQYSAADTQILPGTAKAKADARQMVDAVDEETHTYWDEQTQILHEPPS